MAIPLLLMVLTAHLFCASASRPRCVQKSICLLQSSSLACAQTDPRKFVSQWESTNNSCFVWTMKSASWCEPAACSCQYNAAVGRHVSTEACQCLQHAQRQEAGAGWHQHSCDNRECHGEHWEQQLCGCGAAGCERPSKRPKRQLGRQAGVHCHNPACGFAVPHCGKPGRSEAGLK